MASAEEKFLRELDWVQCNDCLLDFSAITRFVVTNCFHVILCEKCARKKMTNGSSPLIQCLRCKKDERCHVIRYSMDPKIRKWFESPEKIFANFSKYLSSIEQFRESHEMANLRKAQSVNEKMRDKIHAMRAQVIAVNKERDSVDRENEHMQASLLEQMSPERLQHYLSKSIEELENYEKKMTNRASTSKHENATRSHHQRPQPESSFRFDDTLMSLPQQDYRQPVHYDSEETSNMYSDGGSRSSTSNRSNKGAPLLQLVQERNFRKHISPQLMTGRPNYTNFGASAHQSRVPVHYQQPQVTQIRTERQKHAQEESERMERINRSTATYNRPPNMTFKR